MKTTIILSAFERTSRTHPEHLFVSRWFARRHPIKASLSRGTHLQNHAASGSHVGFVPGRCPLMPCLAAPNHRHIDYVASANWARPARSECCPGSDVANSMSSTLTFSQDALPWPHLKILLYQQKQSSDISTENTRSGHRPNGTLRGLRSWPSAAVLCSLKRTPVDGVGQVSTDISVLRARWGLEPLQSASQLRVGHPRGSTRVRFQRASFSPPSSCVDARHNVLPTGDLDIV